MASSDDINIRIKVDTSDVPKAEKQVSTFEKMVDQAVSKMKQALAVKVDTSGVKEAMSAVKSLNSSLSSSKTNIKLAADTSGIQPAVSAVKNLESTAAKPVTVKTAVSGDAASAISAIKSNLASIPKSQTSVVSATDGGSISNLATGFQTLEAKAKSAAEGVGSIGTLARSSLPSVASGASSSSEALSSISPAANEAKSRVADIGESAADSSSKAEKLHGSLQNIAAVTMTAVAAGIGAIGKALKDAVKSSYDLLSTNQQVVGGVETIYGEAAESIKKNAASAFSSAGISANSYMDIATSLGAVMTNSVGGDVTEAARLTDIAVKDMADNSNKMGTSMESVMETYQSLSRGNYEMLDNLKLGYGGSKAELERLIADTNKYRDANDQLSADKFSDIVTAIHETQTRMGILGTTSKEAATTLEGSLNQMKAAWTNWLTDLGKGDVGQIKLDSEALVQSFATWVSNAAPAVVGIFKGLVQAIPATFDDLRTLLPEKLQGALSSLSQGVSGVAPALAPLGAAFAAFGIGGISPLLDNIPLLGGVLSGLTGPLTALSSPLGVLTAAFAGLVAVSPGLQTALGSSLTSLLNSLKEPLSAVGETFKSLQEPINTLVGGVLSQLQGILIVLLPDITSIASSVGEVLLNALNALMGALKPILPIIGNLAGTFGDVLYNALTAFLGILKPIIPVIGTLVNFLGGILLSALSVVMGMLNQLLPVINSLIEPIKGILLAALGILVNALNQILPVLSSLASFLGGLLMDAFNVVMNALQFIIPILENIANAVLPVVSNAVQLLSDIFTAAIDAIKPVVEAVFNFVEEVFTAFVTSVLPVIEQAIEYLAPLVNDVIDSIKGFIAAAQPFIKKIIDTIVSFINNVLLPNVKGMLPVVNSIIVAITKVVGGIVKTVKDIVNFVTAILKGDWKGAWDSAKNIVSDVINNVKNTIGGIVDVGKNMIKGLWNGISNNTNWLFGKISGWASGLVDKVKKLLKIGSPSKVFAREIGRYIPQGISVGIDADAGSVLDSLRGLKTKALNEVSGMRMMSTYSAYDSGKEDSYSKVPTYVISGNQGYSMPLPSNKSQSDSLYQSGQPVVLQVNLNGKTIAKETYKDITYLQKRDTFRGM